MDNHSLAHWQLGLSGDVLPVVQTDDTLTEVDNLSLAELGLSGGALYAVHTDDTLAEVENLSLAAWVVWGMFRLLSTLMTPWQKWKTFHWQLELSGGCSACCPH